MLLEHYLLQFYLSCYTSVNLDSWRWLASLFDYFILYIFYTEQVVNLTTLITFGLNTDQENFEYGFFSQSGNCTSILIWMAILWFYNTWVAIHFLKQFSM